MIDYPKISVVTITYAHERYIVQMLDSVFMQNYSGEIEFIIANDNSPDNTDDIIINYLNQKDIQRNFTIRYTKHKLNKGMMPNFIWALKEASGKYIALCEGDDYWSDPLKLQKQVDFLEQNADYSICFHPIKILYLDGELATDINTKIPDKFEERITLAKNGNYIHTASVVFRNITVDEFSDPEFNQTAIGDYFLYMIISKYGKIGFLNEAMAVYRYGVGVYGSATAMKKLKSELLLFANLFSVECDPEIKQIFYNNFLREINRYQTQIVYLEQSRKPIFIVKTIMHHLIFHYPKKLQRLLVKKL